MEQKARWAAKAAKYSEWAAKAQAQADALHASGEKYRGDVAFFTQPGRIVERDRHHARMQRAYELGQKAKRFREKAANLGRLANANAGDAAARHEAERQAVIAALQVGDFVDCVYGRCEVVKINRKSLRLQGRFGQVVIDAHLCKKVA